MKLLLLLLPLCLLIPSCASKKKKPVPTGQATLIGMIEMVNPEQNYVLIRCEQMPEISAGTELTSVSADGKKSKLALSPERKGHYLTADIKEGQPTVSSLVLLASRTAVPPAPAPTPVVAPPVSPSRSLVMPELPLIPTNLPSPTSTPAAPTTPTPDPQPNLGDLEPVVK